MDVRGVEDAGKDKKPEQDKWEAVRLGDLRADPMDALLCSLLGAFDEGAAGKEEVEV